MREHSTVVLTLFLPASLSRRNNGGVVRAVSSWILLGSRRFAKHSPTGDASQERGTGGAAGPEMRAWHGSADHIVLYVIAESSCASTSWRNHNKLAILE